MSEHLITAESALKGKPDWSQLWWLPCQLSLEVAIARFTVRDLLQLQTGAIVQSCCRRDAEIPVRVNGQPIGWAELEPIGDHIGARITELG